MRNNKGITLIALVITIIILLILAGVSIAMLTGDNGILSQGTKARDDTAKAEAVERINMELDALYALVLADSSKKTFTAEEVAAVATNLTGTTCSITTPAGGTGASVTVTIESSVSGVTGTVTIESAGKAAVTPAK